MSDDVNTTTISLTSFKTSNFFIVPAGLTLHYFSEHPVWGLIEVTDHIDDPTIASRFNQGLLNKVDIQRQWFLKTVDVTFSNDHFTL